MSAASSRRQSPESLTPEPCAMLCLPSPRGDGVQQHGMAHTLQMYCNEGRLHFGSPDRWCHQTRGSKKKLSVEPRLPSTGKGAGLASWTTWQPQATKVARKWRTCGITSIAATFRDPPTSHRLAAKLRGKNVENAMWEGVTKDPVKSCGGVLENAFAVTAFQKTL